MGACGWFHENEGILYQQWASLIFNGTIVEVGNHQGLSLSYIIDVCRINNNIIYAVDIYHMPEFVKNLGIWNVGSFVKLLTMPSAQSISSFEDSSLDLVLIDGNHDYEPVRQDILGFLPKIKPNGILAGHDYGSWSGVTQAVDELLPNRQVMNSVWWHKKAMSIRKLLI